MSQENVERLRAGIELFLAGTSELDREEMLGKLGELWDPEIELDASECRSAVLARVACRVGKPAIRVRAG